MEVKWLVEAFREGKSDGYYTAPIEGEGGWKTDDVHSAKSYTKAEACAVAQALNYFHSPFRWLEWKATEHIFVAEGHLASTERKA